MSFYVQLQILIVLLDYSKIEFSPVVEMEMPITGKIYIKFNSSSYNRFHFNQVLQIT